MADAWDVIVTMTLRKRVRADSASDAGDQVSPLIVQLEGDNPEDLRIDNVSISRVRDGLRRVDQDGLYDAALKSTDAVMGDGTFARMHQDNPDPAIQSAIARWASQDD